MKRKVIINSLKKDILKSILIIISIFIIFIATINYFKIKKNNEIYFKEKMLEFSEIIESSFSNDIFSNKNAKLINKNIRNEKIIQDLGFYKNLINFQIVDKQDNKIIFNSKRNIKITKKYNSNGFFKDSKIFLYNNLNFKKYIITIYIENKDKETVFYKLLYESFLNLLILYILLIIFILFIINKFFKPLKELNKELLNLKINDIKKIPLNNYPNEVQNLIETLNKLFAEVQSSIEREKRFTGNASHELKTPLAIIKSNIEISLNENDNKVIKNNLKDALNAVNNSTYLIEQMLILTRLNPQKNIQNAQKINIYHFLEKLLGEMALIALDKDIDLELIIPDENKNINILSNEHMLLILFRNLLDNSIKYSNSNTNIVVKIIKEKNQKCLIKIIDEGQGLKEENLTKIFERHHRELGNKAKGSGLGLSIVQEIIRLHKNSYIYANLNTPKKGLTMNIVFDII